MDAWDNTDGNTVTDEQKYAVLNSFFTPEVGAYRENWVTQPPPAHRNPITRAELEKRYASSTVDTLINGGLLTIDGNSFVDITSHGKNFIFSYNFRIRQQQRQLLVLKAA